MSERSRRRPTAAALISVVLTALALAGCAPTADPPTPTDASTTPAPFFASDEEALAAAVAVYQEYLDVTQTITEDGGAGAERISAVVTSDEAARQESGFEIYAQQSLHTTGKSQIDSERLQSVSGSSVSFYLCIDLTEVRILDEAGADVTPPNRAPRQPVVAEAVFESDRALIASDEAWTGDDFC